METYYELLEVSSRASPEVIEKAYKVLVKRYHPDVQTDADKSSAEEIMKKINEAYEILSDPDKRAEYDIELESSMREEWSKNNSSAENVKNNTENINNEDEITEEPIQERELDQELNNEDYIYIDEQAKKAYNAAYNDAYYKYLRDLGYRIREKRTFKEWVKHWVTIIVSIILTIFVLWILWLIPPINKLLRSLYNENFVIKFFVDLVIVIIKAIISTIFGGR